MGFPLPPSLGFSALSLLLLAPALQAQGSANPRLDEAVRLLRSRPEPTVRRGAELCLEVNNEKAVELLLDVFNDPQPHYRDIVWEVLPRFTNPYVHKRIEYELASNKRNGRVRQWCAQLLGIYGDVSLAPTLVKALRDKEIFVQRAAARSLGMLRYAKAVRALEKSSRSKDSYLRANAWEALARIEPEAYKTKFLNALQKDKDGGTRCAMLGVLPELYPEEVEKASALALQDDDWRVRFQAAENLESIQVKTAVDSLIRASEDLRPVVRTRIHAAAQNLTGMKWTMRKQWEDWWDKEREDFRFPESSSAEAEAHASAQASAEAQATVTYNGLPVISDHIAFLVDKSSGMGEGLKSEPRSKDRAALRELEETLSRLPEGVMFNIYLYEGKVEAMNPKGPMALKSKSTKQALKFVGGRHNSGYKDIWKALEIVVQDPEIDTVYLLSSGEPEIGLYVHWNRVTEHLKELNRFHKVVIHTVAYSEIEWYREQIQKIAEATGGSYVWKE